MKRQVFTLIPAFGMILTLALATTGWSQLPLQHREVFSPGYENKGGWFQLDQWKEIEGLTSTPMVSRGTNGDYYAVVSLLWISRPYSLLIYRNTGDPAVDDWEYVTEITSDYPIGWADIEVLCSANSGHVIYVENDNMIRDFRFDLTDPSIHQTTTVANPNPGNYLACSVTSCEADPALLDSTRIFTCWRVNYSNPWYSEVWYSRSRNNGDTWDFPFSLGTIHWQTGDITCGNAIAFCPFNDQVFIFYTNYHANLIVQTSGPMGWGPFTSTEMTELGINVINHPAITCSYEGYILITYEGVVVTSDDHEIGYRYSADGGVSWHPEGLEGYAFAWPGDQENPSCASNTEGHFNILYYNSKWLNWGLDIPGMESMRNDFSALNNIAAWIPGAVDKLHDFTLNTTTNACLGHYAYGEPRHGGVYDGWNLTQGSYFGWAEYWCIYPLPEIHYIWPQVIPFPEPQFIIITNLGEDSLFWTVSDSISWLQVFPSSGGPLNHNQSDTVSCAIIGPWPGVGIYTGDLFVMGPDYCRGILDTVHVTLTCTLAPNVSITLTPINPPIIIPSSGGSFNFDANLHNNTSSPQTFSVWIMVQLPSSAWYGPVLGPLSLTLPGSGTLTRLRTQSVPGTAPTGNYTYRGYTGAYPSVKWDSSGFNFTKMGVSALGGLPELGSWICNGEPFPDENLLSAAAPPTEFALLSVAPNPFNPTTVASFELPVAGHVDLRIYDMAGRLVETLVNGWREAGTHEVSFDGSGLASGIYIYHLQAGDWQASGKMVLVK